MTATGQGFYDKVKQDA